MTGKWALVTGAEQGIGRVVAEGLLRAGCDVEGLGEQVDEVEDVGLFAGPCLDKARPVAGVDSGRDPV